MSPTHRTGIGQIRGHGAGMRAGDWLCTCGAIVFASKSACYRCGSKRPDAAGGKVRLDTLPPTPPSPPLSITASRHLALLRSPATSPVPSFFRLP